MRYRVKKLPFNYLTRPRGRVKSRNARSFRGSLLAGWLAGEDAKCKKAQRDNCQCLTRLTLKKGSGALGYSFHAPHPVEGPKPRRFPTHRPTWSKLTTSLQ